MTSPPVPPQAITAAAEVMPGLTREHAIQVAREALEAAAPYLAAAERAAITQLARDCHALANGSEGVEPFADLIGRYRHDGRIPDPVTAERERCAQHLEALAANYPEDVFPPDSTSKDAIGGTAMRHAYRNAARSLREDELRQGGEGGTDD